MKKDYNTTDFTDLCENYKRVGVLLQRTAFSFDTQPFIRLIAHFIHKHFVFVNAFETACRDCIDSRYKQLAFFFACVTDDSNAIPDVYKSLLASDFLKAYTQYISSSVGRQIMLSDLFSKEILVENVSQAVWDWSIQDEMIMYGFDPKTAQNETLKWLSAKSNAELFYEYITETTRNILVIGKAYDIADRLTSP